MIKALNKIGIERYFLNTVKAIYEIPNIIINGEKLTKTLYKPRMPTLTCSIQHGTGSTSKSNHTKKKKGKIEKASQYERKKLNYLCR